ncbi:hypothetical protein B0H11DRAFT_2277387 [Mycena galericulata]|nr:hypothetical protein B0H11DRAFT_2277387 [Mycena galericulata]
MSKPPSSLLQRLPTELLFIILDFLRIDPLYSPFLDCEEKKIPTSDFTRHIRTLSLVSRSLRHLCLPLLFSTLEITEKEQLWALKSKCIQDAEFACLIKKLDLKDVDSLDLISLLPHLRSLRWLDLKARQLDASALAAVNAHPNLTTVAVFDVFLVALRKLSSSTSLPLSKILVPLAELDYKCSLRSPALHSLLDRVPRLAHLILRDTQCIRTGPGSAFFSGLEKLSIAASCGPIPVPWLQTFVERHTSLKTIQFVGDDGGSSWRRNPDILFPLQFIGALEKESLTRTARLDSFSIFRTQSASSLNQWQVVELEITIIKAVGISALRIAGSLAPQVSSLCLRMRRWGRQPISVDDLVSPLARFTSLQKLDLHGMYRHLIFEGHPSALPPSNGLRQTSGCLTAHAALHWLMARVAQSALSLDFIRIADKGDDHIEGRSLRVDWELEVTYQVRWNRELKVVGAPQLSMDERFLNLNVVLSPTCLGNPDVPVRVIR